jgi:hypothetical protein
MRNEMLRMLRGCFQQSPERPEMGWPGHDDRFFLPVSALRRSQRPTSIFCTTCLFTAPVQLFSCLFCRAPSYFEFGGKFQARTIRRYRPSKSVPHDMEEAMPQIAPGFRTFSTKMSCFVCMSSSSGMKRVGVALFALELRRKFEDAPGD